MSKQKEAQVAERLADLRLRASIAGTGHEVTSGFHLTQAQLEAQKNAAEFRQMQQEEAELLEQQRRERPAFKLISSYWSKPLAELQKTAGQSLPDVEFSPPMTDQPITVNLQEVFNDFLAVLKSRDQVLSRDGQNRLILYCGIQSGVTRTVDGVTYRPDVSKVDSYVKALNRLVELNAFDESEYAALLEDEPQPEPVEQSADDLRELAGGEFVRLWGNVWSQWLVSLKTHFNFEPSEAQKIAALRYFENANMGDPQVWNNCRIALSKSGVFPNLLTQEDILCLKMDGKDWDFSRADHRAEFARAKNQTDFGTFD
jgi:hypothetical protein